MYIKDLAPTTEIRNKQKEADKVNKETKRQRQVLGEVFRSEYCSQILSKYDMHKLASELTEMGVKNVVLFCVEEHAAACHRSLVAKRLNEVINTTITNL